MRLRTALASTIAAVALAGPAAAHHNAPHTLSGMETAGIPGMSYPAPRVMFRIYPDLVRRTQRDPQGFTWNSFMKRARTRWHRTHPDEVRRALEPGRINRAIGKELAARRGWTGYQWTALERLWTRESGWIPQWNKTGSGACHIPQALPCSKIPGGMGASVPVAITWGLDYIEARYGSPASAKAHSDRRGWY